MKGLRCSDFLFYSSEVEVDENKKFFILFCEFSSCCTMSKLDDSSRALSAAAVVKERLKDRVTQLDIVSLISHLLIFPYFKEFLEELTNIRQRNSSARL